MRLSGLAISVTVALVASQVPIVESRQAIQIQPPPRDVVKRAEPTGTARIRGRVVSADRGTPVRRANVSLMSAGPTPSMRGAPPELAPGGPPTGRSNQPMAPRRATTDSEGQFEFAGLPAGTYRITASPAQYSSQYLSMSYGANRPMGMYWAEQGQSIELKDGESFDKVVISLPRGAIITGRVTDPENNPLSGVAVMAAEAEAGRGGPMQRMMMIGLQQADEDTVRTASDGTFSLRLKEGTYDFTFKREGYAPAVFRRGPLFGKPRFDVLRLLVDAHQPRVHQRGDEVGGTVARGVSVERARLGANRHHELAAWARCRGRRGRARRGCRRRRRAAAGNQTAGKRPNHGYSEKGGQNLTDRPTSWPL